MPKRSICLINDSFPPVIDGVSNAVVNYAGILHARGDHVSVVTPAVPDADDSQFPFEVVRYPSIDLTRLVGYRAGFPFSAQTLERLEQEQFDLIHCHCPITSAMLSRSLREQIGAPLVLTYHTKFDIDIANAVRSKLLQDEAKRVLVDNISACDEVWTVSHGAGKNLESLGYEGAWRVMPNGVDFPKGRVDDALVAEVSLKGGVLAVRRERRTAVAELGYRLDSAGIAADYRGSRALSRGYSDVVKSFVVNIHSFPPKTEAYCQ